MYHDCIFYLIFVYVNICNIFINFNEMTKKSKKFKKIRKRREQLLMKGHTNY